MQLEIDDGLYQQAQALFRKLGLTAEQATQIFLHKALHCQGMPFAVSLDDKAEQGEIPDISNNEITDTLQAMVEKQLPVQEIENLLDVDYCKSTFAISFAVLKQANTNHQADVKAAAQDSNGHNRYSTKKIAQRSGKYYVICTQWTDRHRAAFVKWRDRMNNA